jgi:transposase-like protein
MRDVESLCEEAGLGETSKSTVATICAELRERLDAFCRRSLYDVNLVALFRQGSSRWSRQCRRKRRSPMHEQRPSS